MWWIPPFQIAANGFRWISPLPDKPEVLNEYQDSLRTVRATRPCSLTTKTRHFLSLLLTNYFGFRTRHASPLNAGYCHQIVHLLAHYLFHTLDLNPISSVFVDLFQFCLILSLGTDCLRILSHLVGVWHSRQVS